jgi:molybdopterin-binding protein
LSINSLNNISGQISHIQAEGSFRLLEIESLSNTFKVIIIDNGNDEYQKGDELRLLFKETEVAIATKKLPEISLQNQLEGIIESIESDQILSRLIIQTIHGPIASVITTSSVRRLQLALGHQVVAMVKTNEIMLSKK